MKRKPEKLRPLLERMARIERMERGKLCRMTGRPHYNHQTWQDGRNVTRYVPVQEAAALQEALDGYRLFMDLARRYADEIVARTRREPRRNPKP